ncbi:40S ribosomal protein S3a-like [Pyrus ussuriensis x Pyrus communis]|uniref:40S ribosomal protein S3a-like n=1 Tax=Pyrus ussuriensis x Pyrus communis TaxID=2448454 RepID=A0A5N5H8N9_9ROSA|nr:40S ribosomal protein S3a-like [Pyrus ussuriensis x Pyrus communis]
MHRAKSHDCPNKGFALTAIFVSHFICVCRSHPLNSSRLEDLLRTNQIRRIRCKMREIMVAWATTSDLNDFVKRLMAESIGRDIEKETLSIFPLQNVFIHKVKMLKAPKFDLDKLMYIHGYEDLGVQVERPDQEETALEKNVGP